MHEQLQKLMKEHLDKQELLTKMTEADILHEYGYSEIHTLMAIGDFKSPNVTEISKYMDMSKGGISKVIKRLILHGLIESYQQTDNHQKIFYRLTDKGHILYEEHNKCHQQYLDRDAIFLQQYSESDLQQIVSFMSAYNKYLDHEIQKKSEKHE
ncbi:MAG: winged helix DNA-binding protein [Erysipelotrichaceae bacterium]|nr:winged helix DNA-binding protein [Erysipelotrichaceae bacterium]